MVLITRLLFIVIGLASISLGILYGAEPPKQTKGTSANAGHSTAKAVHIVVRSRADIKQTFTYSPYPVGTE